MKTAASYVPDSERSDSSGIIGIITDIFICMHIFTCNDLCDSVSIRIVIEKPLCKPSAGLHNLQRFAGRFETTALATGILNPWMNATSDSCPKSG